MSLYRQIQIIKAQIVDTERLLEGVREHPLMFNNLAQKLADLRKKLNGLPKESNEPKVQLLFSGGAVKGSLGIKSSFITKTLAPFQEMVKTQVALVRFGKVGSRGQAKRAPSTELYLTALPVGSFGVELSQLEMTYLFDEIDVSKAMKDVMVLIVNSTIDDITFENTISTTPKRNLTNLKKFLQEISEENSLLKMECGELGFELSKEKIYEAYNRVASARDEENDVFINATFRGLLLDSGRFEIINEDGQKISGFISEDIDEERLVDYEKKFINKTCKIHLKIHRTRFKTGIEKIDYELLEILSDAT